VDAGARDLQARGFTKDDVLVGIAASGRTPYTVGAVSYARSLGAFTIALTCVPDSPIVRAAELSIVPVVGAEVLAGSTRMKAGTAQKLVLNMLSTASMVKLGYVTGNRMTNVQTRNVKLRARAIRILVAETGLDEPAAIRALDAAKGDLRIALVMSRAHCSVEVARQALEKSKGVVQEALRALERL
jgi:N-acetylmuramic acid 6-phosphate etherase